MRGERLVGNKKRVGKLAFKLFTLAVGGRSRIDFEYWSKALLAQRKFVYERGCVRFVCLRLVVVFSDADWRE